LIASQLGIEKVSLDEVPTSAGDPDRSVGMQGAFSVKQVRKKRQKANVALMWQGGKAMLKVTFKGNKSSPSSIPIRIGGEVTAGRHDNEVVLAQPKRGSTSAKDHYEFRSEQQQEGLKLRQQLGQVLEMMELKKLIEREMRVQEKFEAENGLCPSDPVCAPARNKPRRESKGSTRSCSTATPPRESDHDDSPVPEVEITHKDLDDPLRVVKRLQAAKRKAQARPAARVDLFSSEPESESESDCDQQRSTQRRSSRSRPRYRPYGE